MRHTSDTQATPKTYSTVHKSNNPCVLAQSDLYAPTGRLPNGIPSLTHYNIPLLYVYRFRKVFLRNLQTAQNILQDCMETQASNSSVNLY